MVMGKVVSYLKRPFINFAVEERAARAVQQHQTTPKPKAAPLHATEEKVLKQIRREHPELDVKVKEKNEKLGGFLKQVKIVSRDELPPPPPQDLIEEGRTRKLGEYRQRLEHAQQKVITQDLGLPDPPDDRIPPGKVSFRQAMEILKEFIETDSESDAERFASDRFKLAPEKTRMLLTYFRPFAAAREYQRVPPVTLEDLETKPKSFPDTMSEGFANAERRRKSWEESQRRVDRMRKKILAKEKQQQIEKDMQRQKGDQHQKQQQELLGQKDHARKKDED